MAEVAGHFSPGFEHRGAKASLSSWVVATGDWHTAKRVVTLLGGAAQMDDASSGKRWAVVTQLSELVIVTDKANDPTPHFRLLNESDLGVFRLTARSQMLTSALIRDFGEMPGRVVCRLSIEPFQFKTRNGLVVRYMRPTFTSLA
jgi:hypothetical protein